MTATQSSTAKASVPANNRAEEGGYTFRAPPSVSVVCPYCTKGEACDWCDGTGSMLAEDFAVEFDLHRLDCAVDALKGADLTQHREALARIASNLADLLEPVQ
jgi:hypothetical protein